ncbi:MAG: peptidoglycan-binding protein [Eubacteriales bacterium]|nr:peptidoglycan-binding protein [Eubacteriales bacterium]
MPEFPYIPEFITVHLGLPNDSSAPNVTVPFLEYIQNVASSEIYPTWPESSIRANVYAQITYALNRIYTEYYRSRGYDFDITNTTAYDQAFVYGRDLFENTNRIVGDIFDQYLARPGAIQPLFAAYCDGRRVQCEGLSQWGTVTLAQQGLTPYQILTNYYGDNLDIRTAPVRPLTESYPGVALRLGTVMNEVRVLQTRLNRIAANYPAIPRITPVNAIFDKNTEDAVRAFQEIFGLDVDGVVGKTTWYQIQNIYNAVKRLTDLNAEGITQEEVQRQYPTVLREGATGEGVRIVQYILSVLNAYDPMFDAVAIDGIYGPATRQAVETFQRIANLTVDGIVGTNTWNSLKRAYDDVAALFDQQSTPIPLFPLAPEQALVLGSQGPAVLQIQGWINTLASAYPELTTQPETGYYGQNTRMNVMAFQELFGLPTNGIVNAVTWNRLATEADRISQGA